MYFKFSNLLAIARYSEDTYTDFKKVFLKWSAAGQTNMKSMA